MSNFNFQRRQCFNGPSWFPIFRDFYKPVIVHTRSLHEIWSILRYLESRGRCEFYPQGVSDAP